jgi:hypothetical protein
MRRDSLLDNCVVTRNRRGFLCGPCCGYVTRGVSCKIRELELGVQGVITRVEAGSNTSTLTLRVVGGDEKGSLKSERVK